MPRTKAPRRRTIQDIDKLSKEQKDIKHAFDRIYATKQQTLREFYETKKKQLKENFEMMLEVYGPELTKTLGQIREEALKKNAPTAESHSSINTHVHSETKTRVSASSQKDDGYVTDAVNLKPNSVQRSRRMSRSVSRSNFSSYSKTRTPSTMGSRLQMKGRRSSSASSAMGPPRSARPRYRTPMNRGIGNSQYPPITPKIMPNTPMTVMRKPRQGETVVSLSGSPLIVNSNSDNRPNCNIPLADGTIISLLPNKINNSSVLNVPVNHMLPETTRHLKTLQDNIKTYLDVIAAQNRK